MEDKFYKFGSRINTNFKANDKSNCLIEFMVMQVPKRGVWKNVTEENVRQHVEDFVNSTMGDFVDFSSLEFIQVKEYDFGFTVEYNTKAGFKRTKDNAVVDEDLMINRIMELVKLNRESQLAILKEKNVPYDKKDKEIDLIRKIIKSQI